MGKEIDIYRPNGSGHNTENIVRGAINEETPRMRVKGSAADKIGAVYEDVERFGHSRMIPFSVGHVEKRMRDFAERNGIEIAEGDLYMSASSLQHAGMSALWGRKMADLAHGEFVLKLQYVATKYGVTVHKINRYYPSSKTCTCGYVNHGLQLHERTWVCPECGTVHKRDLLAANNILRQGIAELESGSKTSKRTAKRLSRWNPTITRQTA